MSQVFVLFDMDGTITAHGEPIKDYMIHALNYLSNWATIGIVTGSDLASMRKQLDPLLDEGWDAFAEEILYFPCNGTQQWYWDSNLRNFGEVDSVNMRDHLGESSYQTLIQTVIDCQHQFCTNFSDLSYSGTFIQYRGSLLNWSPVGRNATAKDRKQFIAADIKFNIRNNILTELRTQLNDIDVTFVQGGQTSFDIYPTGWNKTFVLNHFDDDSIIWFVGDRCEEDGNDRALYEALPRPQVFITTCPKQTVQIIGQHIIPQIKDCDYD